MNRLKPDDLPADCEEWMKKCFYCKHSRMYGGNNAYKSGDWYCTLKECRNRKIKPYLQPAHFT